MGVFARRYDQINVLIKRWLIPSTIPEDERFLRNPLRLYKTPLGVYFLPAEETHNNIIKEIKAGRVSQPEVIDCARRCIKKDSIVLDIGANFGQASLIFSELVGDDGQVWSFEADDYIFHVLQKNISANNCHNIRAFFRLAYHKSGESYLAQDFRRFYPHGPFGLAPNMAKGRSAETIAVDDLNIRAPVSLIKIGMLERPLSVMRGAIETIRRHQMPIIFEYDKQVRDEFGTTFQDYLDLFDSIAYKVERTIYDDNYLIVPGTKRVSSHTPAHHRRTGNFSGKINEQQIAVESSNASNVPSLQKPLCKFLKTRAEIDECTAFLHRNGLASHHVTCKDWDLAHIIPEIGDGNFLDMGSSDSYILKNVSLKRTRGEKYGIDLREPDVPIKNVKYIVGDLSDTKLPDKFFNYITCLSVIEHEVDFTNFAREAARLLDDKGKLFVTFDYWTPKITSPIMIYGLKWQPLDEKLLRKFIAECERYSLWLVEDMDWTTNKAVIRHGYYSPYPTISYTFGLVVFKKL